MKGRRPPIVLEIIFLKTKRTDCEAHFTVEMDELKLVDGVFSAAFPTWGGAANRVNREHRLGVLTNNQDMYEEWELVRLENEKAVSCICGMPAKPGRSVILKSKNTMICIYIGSQCVRYFPNVDIDLLWETKDGYSREDGFVTDDEEEEENDDEVVGKVKRTRASDRPNLRPRRHVKYADSSSSDDESVETLPRRKLQRVDNDVAVLVFEACKDYFSRPTHTGTEQSVFLGYLKSQSHM